MAGVKFAVPCRFEPDLLDGLIALQEETGRVGEVFGALPRTVTGSGRTARRVSAFGDPTWDDVAAFTRRAQAHGIAVNYVLNSACLGNYEFTAEGRRALVEYLGQVRDVGPDIVTVALPYLMAVIKQEFPELRVNVSVLARVNTPQMARMFEGLGVDRITVDYHANRDFEALAEIRRSVGVELQLLTNDGCLYACPYTYNHDMIGSHGSQARPGGPEGCIDWCLMRCSADRAADLSHVLRSPWIRPEDVPWYAEQFGVGLFKISGRQHPVEWILGAARAYCNLRYDGNLLDIIGVGFPHWAHHPQTRGWAVEHYGVEPFAPPAVYADNRLLEGFSAAIRKKGGCAGRSHCGACDLCEVWTARAMTDRGGASAGRYRAAVGRLLDDVVSGRWTVDGEPAPAGAGADRKSGG